MYANGQSKVDVLKVPFDCELLASTFMRIYRTYFLVEGIVPFTNQGIVMRGSLERIPWKVGKCVFILIFETWVIFRLIC